MINVHAAANNAIQVINPDILAPFYRSTGFTQNAAFEQVPSYAAPINVSLQVQATGARDLKHIEGLNVQGVVRSIHMYGDTQGVVRITQTGGDLLYFPEVVGGPSQVWKVIKVVETWSDWCHLIVNLQTDTAPPS